MDLLREKLRAKNLHRVLYDGDVGDASITGDPATDVATGLAGSTTATGAEPMGDLGGIFGEPTDAELSQQVLSQFAEFNPPETEAEPSVLSNILSFISENKGAMAALAMAAPALAPVIGIANFAAAAQQGNPIGAFSGSLGSMVGSATGIPGAGPALGMLGGLAGQVTGNVPGVTGVAPSSIGAEGDRMDFDLGGIAEGLGGLYSATRANRGLEQQAATLASLYGPTSPYAQALREQLARRDAAAGRRSQYGPREVELQAKLADVYSRNAPNTMAAQQAANIARNKQLFALGTLAKRTGALDWAQRQLGDLWNTPIDMTGFQTPLETPVYGDWAQMAPTAQTMGPELGTGLFGLNDLFLNY